MKKLAGILLIIIAFGLMFGLSQSGPIIDFIGAVLLGAGILSIFDKRFPYNLNYYEYYLGESKEE